MSDAASPCVESHHSLQVNGDDVTVAAGTNVTALLALLELGDRRVAVALNGDVVPRSRYAETPLAAGDRVEILEAVGGG